MKHLKLVGYKTFGDLKHTYHEGIVYEVSEEEATALLTVTNHASQKVFIEVFSPPTYDEFATRMDNTAGTVTEVQKKEKLARVETAPPQPSIPVKKTFQFGKKKTAAPAPAPAPEDDDSVEV